MDDFKKKVNRIFGDANRLKGLLALEKERRGVPQNSLVFIGMANVANQGWCAHKAVLRSRSEEMLFFTSYLNDRIMYAHRLGLVTELPGNDKALLDVGSGITNKNVERIFKEVAKASKNPGRFTCVDRVGKNGSRVCIINPMLSPFEKQFYSEQAAEDGIRVAGLEDFSPMERGKICQEFLAEQYPTIRWNFPWGRYTVVGVPDGLTKGFAYEFKTTVKRNLFSAKEHAHFQAWLYAHFFCRPKIRVQIYVIEDNFIETFEDVGNSSKAEELLAAFSCVDMGQKIESPQAFKCKTCEFRENCTIRKTNNPGTLHANQLFLPFLRN